MYDDDDIDNIIQHINRSYKTYKILQFIYERMLKKGNVWIKCNDYIGKKKKFGESYGWVPAKLYRLGIVDKKIIDRFSYIKLTDKGISICKKLYDTNYNLNNRLLGLNENMHSLPIERIEKTLERPINQKIQDAERLTIKKPEINKKQLETDLEKHKVTDIESEILSVLYTNKAFNRSNGMPIDIIVRQIKMQKTTIEKNINNLIKEGLIKKNKIDTHYVYYLTKPGYNKTLSLMLHGKEFTSDSLESYLLNYIGRKIIHVIEEGMTVQEIAEKIGFGIDKNFVTEPELSNKINLGTEITYELLVRLEKFSIIELDHHNFTYKSSRVKKIIDDEKLTFLRAVATIIEFLPTLFIETEDLTSPIRTLLNPYNIVKIKNEFSDIKIYNAPEQLIGFISNIETLGYWIGNDIEKIIRNSKKWKNIAIVKSNGKHYFMLKKSIW